MGSLKWHGPAEVAKVDAEFRRRLAAAAIGLAGHAKRLIGVEGAGKPSKKGGKLRYGANPSAPGDPPHKQTGRLQASVTWEWAAWLSVRVGTNVRYGRILELGLGIVARPWLRRALYEFRSRINAILGRGKKI
jgi:hypothetical protein